MEEILRAAAKRGRHVASSARLKDEYTEEEFAFLKAMDEYKQAHHRPNPTCCEVLAVFKRLGYVKVENGGEAL